MNLHLEETLQVLSWITGSAVIAFLAVAKFKHDVKKEKKDDEDKSEERELLGIRGLLDANAALRDELRKDYLNIKSELSQKILETDMAWTRARECESHRQKQEAEIAGMKMEMEDMRCEFAEFKKICETQHAKN